MDRIVGRADCSRCNFDRCREDTAIVAAVVAVLSTTPGSLLVLASLVPDSLAVE